MNEEIVGTRIREQRRRRELTQAELARRAGISPSYLNLIERNKRPVAGALLRKLAEELGLAPSDLDSAAERRLAAELREVSSLPGLSDHGPESDAAPELIARFPGWARAMATLARSERAARETARALSDRLTHDPFLGETVHSMLGHVAAIRSAAEILTEFDDLDAADMTRFHAIVRDEAERLTATGEALAAYFDRTDQTESRLTPQDEIEAFYEARRNHFPELEHGGDPEAAITRLLGSADELETDAARARAERRLRGYAEDARAMPSDQFRAAAKAARYDVERLAREFGLGTDAICRRLATLPPVGDTPAFGYALANASGTIVELMAIDDLLLPRYAAACPLWALFRAQQQPGRALAQHAELPSGARFVFVAIARSVGSNTFGAPQHYVTDMLAIAAGDAENTVYGTELRRQPEPVGPACRLCPRPNCLHRVADPLAG